jgi:hypothetical protein
MTIDKDFRKTVFLRLLLYFFSCTLGLSSPLVFSFVVVHCCTEWTSLHGLTKECFAIRSRIPSRINMDNRTQTPMQESSATVEVAGAFDDVENVPLCDSPTPPYDVSHDDLSSDTECAADATNEPQPNDSPDVSSRSTAESFAGHDSRDENGFDIGQEGGLIDDESELSATSDYNGGRDDESTLTVASENRKVDYRHGRGYQAGHEYWLVECMPRQLQPANRVHKLAERRTTMQSIGHPVRSELRKCPEPCSQVFAVITPFSFCLKAACALRPSRRMYRYLLLSCRCDCPN